MKEVLPIGCSIGWRCRYDERGEVTGKFVLISIQANVKEIDGNRFATNHEMSEAMFNNVKDNEPIRNSYVEHVCLRFHKGIIEYAIKQGEEYVLPEGQYSHLKQTLLEGMSKFIEKEMPWYHTFYLMKTLHPGEHWLDENGHPVSPVEEPTLVIVKAD